MFENTQHHEKSGILDTSNREELKDRVEAKKKQWQSKIAELKADSRKEAREKQEVLEKKLENLKQQTKEGYENLTDKAAEQINKFLASH